jgi:hypothetical protein
MNFRTASLASNLLYLCEGECGKDADISQFDSAHLERLTNEFYAWSDAMETPMIEAGLGDDCLGDLWPNLEWVYLCVRLGHGVGFADNFISDSPYYAIAQTARELAKKQPFIEDGAYKGDDGRIYIYNYHSS